MRLLTGCLVLGECLLSLVQVASLVAMLLTIFYGDFHLHVPPIAILFWGKPQSDLGLIIRLFVMLVIYCASDELCAEC